MTWAEYDAAVYSHELRTQQAADGHRVVATLLFNAWFTNSDAKNGPVVAPKLPAEFWSLPLLDKASPPPATPAETPAQTWARLQVAGLL